MPICIAPALCTSMWDNNKDASSTGALSPVHDTSDIVELSGKRATSSDTQSVRGSA